MAHELPYINYSAPETLKIFCIDFFLVAWFSSVSLFVQMDLWGDGWWWWRFRRLEGNLCDCPFEGHWGSCPWPLPPWPDLSAQRRLWSLDPRAAGYHQLALLLCCGGCCGQPLTWGRKFLQFPGLFRDPRRNVSKLSLDARP